MSSDLNKFLLTQLNENGSNNTASTSKFKLPKFQTSKTEKPTDENETKKFDLPSLKTIDQNQFDADLTKIKNDLANVQIQEPTTKTPTSPIIDLTIALRTANLTEVSKPKSTAKIKTVEKFHIPFVDCDRIAEVESNEYCQLDVSNMKCTPLLHRPSSLGRVICMKYRKTTPFKIIRKCKANININPFKFCTKSPDDIVQEALEKHKLRHLNNY